MIFLETKALQEQVKLELPGYLQYWYSAEKKGYSGTAIFTKHAPLSVRYGVGVEAIMIEYLGRKLSLLAPAVYGINVKFY